MKEKLLRLVARILGFKNGVTKGTGSGYSIEFINKLRKG